MGVPTRFPFLPIGGYRDFAACVRHHDLTLWDATAVDDGREQETARQIRLTEAKRICWTRCPVRTECAADATLGLDEGVRGGHLMPSLNAVGGGSISARDAELVRLLREGVPLDEAAPRADLMAKRAGRPKAAS